jgi:hypothetical protein
MDITFIVGAFIAGLIANVIMTKFVFPKFPKWFADKDGRIPTDGLIDLIIKYFKKRKEKKAKE